MKTRARICLYIFLICSFFALGILGYFVFKDSNPNVMVGSKKFVKVQSVQNAVSYAVTVENDNNDQTDEIFYNVSKVQGEEENISDYTISVSNGDGDLIAEEHYQQEITSKGQQTGKIDCKIKNYTVNFFSGEGKTLHFDDQELLDVEPSFFCCIVSEYVGDFFCKDGNYKVTIIAYDDNGDAIQDEQGNIQQEVIDYNFVAYYEQDFAKRGKYYYDGQWGDYIISSKEELDRLVKWAILYRQGNGKDITFFVKTNQITPRNINSLVFDSIVSYPEYDALEESAQYAKMYGKIGMLTNFNYYLDENFLLTYKDLQQLDDSYEKINYNIAKNFIHQKDDNYAPTYISDIPEERSFNIENAEDEVDVFNSEQLFMVVQSGAKPKFVDGKSEVAETIYNKALNVLRQINNSNSLTPYEKVLNIYNYICGEIVYDYVTYKYMELKDDLTIQTFGNFSCFYLEGVFYDFGLGTQYAVCDGLAKAISLMCNIEGINCIKINGRIVDSGNHAWNKVYIKDEKYDIDGWFYLDPTWGEGTYISNGQNYQVLTHSYFLFAQDDRERKILYPSDTELTSPGQDYEYYKKTQRTLSGEKVSLYVESDKNLIDNFTLSQMELEDGKTSTVLELKFSKEYLLKENSKIAELIRLSGQLSAYSAKIYEYEEDILLEQEIMNQKLESLRRNGADEQTVAQERNYWQMKIDILNEEKEEYQSQYNQVKSKLETWFRDCGVKSNWEWVATDGDNTLSIFRFYK